MFPGCIFSNMEDNNDNKYPNYRYHISFSYYNNSEFYLIIPFLIKNNDPDQKNFEILTRLNKYGLNYKTVFTPYGLGLNISNAFDNITIQEQPMDDIFQYKITLLNSLTNSNEAQYWIYSSTKGIFGYEIKMSDKNKEFSFHIYTQLTIGWQIVKASIVNYP